MENASVSDTSLTIDSGDYVPQKQGDESKDNPPC